MKFNPPYTLVIEEAENGGFGVYCPALNSYGACTASGDSIEEAILNGIQAIEDFIEVLKEGGIIPPEPDNWAHVRLIRAGRDPMNSDVLSPSGILHLRETLGLTQKQLAEKVSVDTLTVSRWERGATLPRGSASETLLKLAEQVNKGICSRCGGTGRL